MICVKMYHINLEKVKKMKEMERRWQGRSQGDELLESMLYKSKDFVCSRDCPTEQCLQYKVAKSIFVEQMNNQSAKDGKILAGHMEETDFRQKGASKDLEVIKHKKKSIVA